MPLAPKVAPGGRSGIHLLRHRGRHDLVATGQARRLIEMLPAHIQDDAGDIVVRYSLATYLVAPTLLPRNAVRRLPSSIN